MGWGKFILKRGLDLVVPGAGVAWDVYDYSKVAINTVDAIAHNDYGRAARIAAGGIAEVAMGFKAQLDEDIPEEIEDTGDSIYGGLSSRLSPGSIRRITGW
jgi:hypothetical protein